MNNVDGALAPSAPRSAAQLGNMIQIVGTINSARYCAGGDAAAQRPYLSFPTLAFQNF